MGLDFDRANAHWGYMAFHRFRQRLAAAEGLDLNRMEGFGGMLPDTGHPLISWNEVDTTLTPFLHHSDCDGYLTVRQMRQIIPRMKEIISGWPEDDRDRIQAEHLIEGMEDCIATRRRLNFC